MTGANAAQARGLALALAVGSCGGWLFAEIRMPLPWMIGAMCATTVAALAGAPLAVPAGLRASMIAVVGTMLGSAFTPEVMAGVALWAPSLAALLLYTVAIVAVVAPILARAPGFNAPTAFYAGVPGGFSEMVFLGEQSGGDERRMSLIHSVRILVTVFTIPLWFRLFHGYDPGTPAGLGALAGLGAFDGLILALSAVVGFVAGRRLRIPAAPLLGPMMLSAAAHLSGLTSASPPAEVVNLAQIVLGAGVGARFVGFEVRRVFGTMALGAGVTALMLALAVGAALGLERLTGLPFTGLILAFAP
ncbi:MAG: AbrB family transcriptional regulator, partial [Pseudomonadota bacterium]